MNLSRLVSVVAIALAATSAAHAQNPAAAQQTPVAAPSEAPKDALGRDTPLGTLLGFLRAARDGNGAAASTCLNTTLRGQAAEELVHQLYIVLDTRLPARLGEISDRPEGSVANPLKPDVDVIGTVQTSGGPLDILVERVVRGPAGRVWLFSRETLDAIPDVYDEIHLVRLDRYFPRPLATFRIGGIRLLDWICLFLVFPLVYRLLGVIGNLVRPVVTVWRRHRAPAAPRVESTPGFLRLLLLAVIIRLLITTVDMSLIERQFWSTVARMFVLLSAVWVLLLTNAWGERRLLRRYAAAGHEEVAAPLRLVRRMVDVLVVAAGTIVTLRFFDVDPTAALAGLGIGGIAVALAAQKTLENVIGGLSIIFDRAVRVGDFIKVNETFGTADYIGLRSTRIRTLDRTILSIPNGQIANVGIETLSLRDKFWFHHFVGLRYATTARQLREVVGESTRLLAGHKLVEAASVRVRFLRFGPSSLDIELFAYIVANSWERFLEIQEELLVEVMTIVERAGTAVAIPSQTLYLADTSRAGSGAQPASPLPAAFDRHDAVT
jgi:MscS family membrane protein